MKKLGYLYLLMMFLCIQGLAQQDPDLHFSHYHYNNLIINPSYAGKTNDISFAGFFRNQWVGFNGAPVTGTFSVHSPIPNKNIGVGLHVITDKIGLESHLSVMSNYAYHIHMKKAVFSMGLSAGFKQFSIDQSKLQLETPDQIDQVYTGLSAALVPNFGFGLHIRGKNYYAAASVTNLNQPKLKYNSTGVSKLSRHYYMKLGYDVEVSKGFVIKPMGLLSYQPKSPIQAYLSALFEKDQAYWAGVGYRTGDAMAVLVGVHMHKIKSLKFKEKITIGYAFDWTVNGLPMYSSGSHEIMLLYDFHLKLPNASHNPKYRRLE
jgi:type IX secretion system PorP/SprF family membrane protein